ncbi:Beta-galactosidase C-terminal domain [Streptomyces sp. NPDC020192]|uniref:Beta-galactosidase C-terminal domain n=1 Tax=Streptomyces sp. NPDC020192 TaxID=3365066 RepID=UPI0037BB5158
MPPTVTATTGTSPEGRRVHVLHNWSWEPARVTAPADLTDALGGDSVPARAALELGPWDVRIFTTADEATA